MFKAGSPIFPKESMARAIRTGSSKYFGSIIISIKIGSDCLGHKYNNSIIYYLIVDGSDLDRNSVLKKWNTSGVAFWDKAFNI